jgi:excisionase family DNA binding protein
VSTRKRNLSPDEIARPFQGEAGARFPVILSPADLAALFGLSVKTVYEWIGKGRLDGAFRKRGKHVLIWRDRAVELIMNGKEWTDARGP